MKTIRVAIIGAGAAGLCAARHVASRPNMQPIVFERSKEVGGVWCYTDETGKDEFGLKVHSAMYKNLRTNLPKEVMEFPDFPFSSECPSFLPHQMVKEYLLSYCAHFGLQKFIKFGTLVQHVEPVVHGGDYVWKFTVKNLREDSVSTALFDVVLVCNGHYATPNIPSFPGEEQFKGSLLHSHSFRAPEPYNGKKVLVLGCKSSGKDIALDVAKHAKSVAVSHRTSLVTCLLPQNVTQVSPLNSFKDDGVTVRLEDGSELEIDDVIYCTGYKYDFTFLAKSCGITTDEGRISHLYKHVINVAHPSMMFLGVCSRICPFPQFHYQVLYCLATLDGTLKLPPKVEMENDVEKDYQDRLERGLFHRNAHVMGEMQWAYNDYLADAIKVPRLHPKVQKLYSDVHYILSTDLCHFREYKVSVLDNGYYKISKD